MGRLDASGTAMIRIALLAWITASVASAHVGSPDVYFDGKAGAYQCFVTIRTPQVIPGVAEVELRITSGDVETVRITPMPLTGPGAKFAPTADLASRSSQDPHFYAGSLWMMTAGSWQVKVTIDGKQGSGELRVPVPVVARRTLEMDSTLGVTLFVLMIFLAIGAISIAGASAREGKLVPCVEPSAENRRRAWIVMGLTTILVAGVLYFGDRWWKAEAAGYSRILFKPLAMKASIEGNALTMKLEHTGWFQPLDFSDLVPDHGYPMHLFIVSPELNRMWHLHPQMVANGIFRQMLPSMPNGEYELFGDIVHQTGLPETVTAQIDTPAIASGALTGDDSTNTLTPGYRMVLETPGPYKAKQLQVLKFRLLDSTGQPATGMELYLGMPAHAAVVKKDRTVFAHLHPSGTVPMAALAMTQPESSSDPHAGHVIETQLPSEVTFPYGFPESGSYRLFIQMKRAGTIETGSFDVAVIR